MSLPTPTPDDSGRQREPLQPTENTARDAWSVQIANVSGIPIRLHFTFLLLVTWFAVIGVGRGGATHVLFLLGIFLCVALHELGHSIVAQRYGYKVRDIVLYPIGGVASIEGSPRPRHELWIALAGPAVNVVIAVLLGIYLAATRAVPLAELVRGTDVMAGNLAARLLVANIVLVLFNLIPAFPMDGGRVLRAALALRLGRTRATRIASRIGQFMAILLGLWGLGVFGREYANFFLVFIAIFVYFGAGQEAMAEESRAAVEGASVRAAMVREFQTLSPGDSLRRAAELLLSTHQQDFPVVFGDEVVGVLSRSALLRGLAQQGETAYVSEAMSRDFLIARPVDSLEEMLTRPDGVQRAPILVMEGQHLVGMLTSENLMEFLTLRQIARARAEQLEAQA